MTVYDEGLWQPLRVPTVLEFQPITMTSDRAAELKRLKAQQRYRKRKAGLLPPLPRCPKCEAKILTDRWMPFCSICARRSSQGERTGYKARPVRLAAEQIIRELRAENRATNRANP